MRSGRKNVFVVGAGASKEFGLPTGDELKQGIANFCDIRFEGGCELKAGDYRIVETLQDIARASSSHQRSVDINPYLHAGWRIRDNMPLAPSIDNFLDTHRHDSLIVEFGKLAIAACILEAERRSKLFYDANRASVTFDFRAVSQTWIARLFGLLVAQRTFESFLEALSEITFITFNYDRCIEQFFCLASRRYFDLSGEGTTQVLQSLNVIRPYGSVGPFSPGQSNSSNFGKTAFRQELIDISHGLRTFTEGSDSEFPERASEAFTGADLVFFLGFGFIPLNMEILFSDNKFEVSRVFGTGKGISENGRQSVESELSGILFTRIFKEGLIDLGSQRLKIVDMTCSDLIYEFQRELM